MRQKLFAGRLSNKTANIIDNYENHKINVQDTLPAHPAVSRFRFPLAPAHEQYCRAQASDDSHTEDSASDWIIGTAKDCFGPLIKVSWVHCHGRLRPAKTV